MAQPLVAVALLAFAGCTNESARSDGSRYFGTQDGLVEFQFPSGWHENEEDHPYDLQCLSKDDRMTTGVFVFMTTDLAEGVPPHKLLELQIDDMRSKRGNFKVQEQEATIQPDKKTLTTVVYSGEKEFLRYYYRFTLIEFREDPDLLVVVLQTAIPSEWARNKSILEEITKSAQLRRHVKHK